MKLPELPALRRELADGLAAALRASIPDGLDDARASQAADSVIDGRGLVDPVAGLFGTSPVCTLVGFDADQIHSWVFDSERVQVSSGASGILDGLNQRVDDMVREIPGVHGKLYSAGGGGMLFADTRTDNVVESVRGWLEAQSQGLRFTVVAEPLHAGDLLPGTSRPVHVRGSVLRRFQVVDGMRGAIVRTQIAMRGAKSSRLRPSARLVKLRPGEVRAERCRSCGRRPPSGEKAQDNRPELWCGHCQGLRDIRRFVGADGLPITFADLAERIPRRRQYLGYVAIDGNSMGALFQGVGDFLQFRAFSAATTAVYEHARAKVPKLLVPYLKAGEDPHECSFSLLSGGDEVTLVLPAAAAPGMALEMLRTIEDGFENVTSKGSLLHKAFDGAPELLTRLRAVGAAAGVITAHANYPVRLLRRYANDLQKEAKRQCAFGESKEGRRCRSALAWLLLTDSSPLTEGLDRVATNSDLSLEAFARLLSEASAARVKGLPSSALQNLLSHFRQEEHSLRALAVSSRRQVLDLVAANFFRYQLARSAELAAWWEEVREIDSDDRDAVALWFQHGGGRRLEQLVDLLSLGPFPEEVT